MKRVCVFAHWDKDNIIDDYVLYYLKALRDVADDIVFVSDSDLAEDEISKLDGFADYVLAQKHGEYDFGSYKRGFFLAKEKGLVFDELIFANDSCYGPFYPLKPIFDKMATKKCDFWGMTRNRYGVSGDSDADSGIIKPIYSPHIQSYFIVLSKKVFDSSVFTDFLNSIKKENSKNKIIKNYEIGLSEKLKKAGFRADTYIRKYKFVPNALSVKWDKLVLKDGFPFIKTCIIKNGLYYLGENVIQKISDYPIEIIKKNSSRLMDLYENLYAKENLYRKIRCNILKECPWEVRYIVSRIEKYSFIVLNTICFNKLKKF